MRSRKRPRESGSSSDIRTLFQQAREQTALQRCGPFFLERILFPRLVNGYCRAGGLLHDPTRLCSGIVSGRQPRFGSLALPQRVEANAQLHYYRQLQYKELRTVVPPRQMTAMTLSAVSDIVLDMQEQFAIVCQPRHLSAYCTDGWLGSTNRGETSISSSPVVTVEARGWRSGGFGFSAVQFLSSSLHIVAGYHHAPIVDIFDLEEVDEETSAPQQRFNLTQGSSASSAGGGGGGGSNTEVDAVFANDVAPITEQVSLAALSSGLSVWLDRRSGKVETCTGSFAREYNIGSRSARMAGRGPLTAVAFLCRDDPVNIVCGTLTGALQLWDVRCPRDYVALHQTSSAISRLHPSYASPLRGVVWLNNYAGDVLGVSIGHSDMRLFAETKRADAVRSTTTFHLPSPRLSVMDPAGLLVCPHVSSNSLMFFDVSLLLKGSPFPTHARANTGGVAHEHQVDHGSTTSDSDICSSDVDEDGDEDEGVLPEQSHSSSSVSGNGTGGRMPSRGEGRKVHKISLSNVLNFEGHANVSACSVWSKCNRILVGDAEGRVQLA